MLKDFFKKYGWRYLPGGILLILCAWIATRAPLALGNAIDLAVQGEWSPFFKNVWWILIIALGVFVTRFAWRWFIIGTSREMEIYLRDRLYEHLQFLPLDFYGRNRSGDLMAYAINDVGAVRMMFGMIVAQILNALSSILFSISEMTVSVHPKLTLFAMLPVPFAAVFVVMIGRQIQARSRRVQELFAGISGHVQENINGMRVIKAFAQETPQNIEFEKESDEKRRATIRLHYTSALLHPVIQILFGISYAVGLTYGGVLVLDGSITLDKYVAFNSYLTMIIGPILMLGRVANQLERGMASYKRLNAIMTETENDPFDRVPDQSEIGGAIEAKDLTFMYSDGKVDALSNVSFTVKRGGTLGIVGPTGSGKTTILSLITKLRNPPEGQLFIDGRDVTKIPAISIRNAVGYVPQDGFLFDVSIRENIDFFSGKNDEDVMKAVKAAAFEGDLSEMPEGLDTKVGERGNHLSGGQRQRVSLARALIRDPKILLLDDTLSAVDAYTENVIIKNLKTELAGRTAIIVAHRLSAVREADEILFMDHGRIVERGTHDELMMLNGRYAEMYLDQKKEAEKHAKA